MCCGDDGGLTSVGDCEGGSVLWWSNLGRLP